MAEVSDQKSTLPAESADIEKHKPSGVVTKVEEIINASGHSDQLTRHYGLWSICGAALNIGTKHTLSHFINRSNLEER